MIDSDKEAEIPAKFISEESKQATPVRRWLPHRRGNVTTCKVWQLLPCNFRFFLNGRIMCGPGRPYWAYLIVLQLIILITFLVFDILPFYEEWPDLILGVVMSCLVLMTIYNLFRVTLRDPGYVLPHWFSSQFASVKVHSYQDLATTYGYTSYCRLCKVFQFPDTYHCDDCHACIDGLDHHCTMLGTCIGKRNYSSFYLFLLSSNAALWLAMIVSITHFVQNWLSYGAGYAFLHAVPFYLIVSTLAIPPFGLYVLTILPFLQTRLIYCGFTLKQSEDFIHRLRVRQKRKFLTTPAIIRLFFKTFYVRVFKTPPDSQIPTNVLQMTVAMPAVPRTVLLNNRHNRLQIEMRNPQTIKFFYNPWILTKHRIDADIEVFGPYCIPVLNFVKDPTKSAVTSSKTQCEIDPGTSPEKRSISPSSFTKYLSTALLSTLKLTQTTRISGENGRSEMENKCSQP